VADVAQEFGAQIGQGTEYPARDDMALDFGEPVFDLVEPRGVGWGEVQADVGMSLEKGLHQLGLMSRKIVGNDMDRLAHWLGGDDLLEEADELGTGVAWSGLAQDGSALGFQGGVERKGAVAKVFKAVRFGPPGRKRQDGIETIQSLDGAFFIHTEDGGMSRRMQIEPDDVGRFGLEIRIVAGHVMTQAMGLQAVAAPDSGHPHVRGAQLLGQASTAPMGAAIIGATPCPIQNACLQSSRAFGRDTPLVPSHQTTHALCAKSSRPPLHIRRAANQISGRRTQTPPAGQFQNDPRSSGILRPYAARALPADKFSAFGWSKNQAFGCHPENLTRSVANINVTLH